MKYFTKEYYVMEWLSHTDKVVRKSKLAETKNEVIYQFLYNKRCSEYIRRDKMNDWYIDPVKELNKIDEYVNAPNISDEERRFRAKYRDIYYKNNKNKIDSGTYFKFDREFSKRKFDVDHNSKIELYSHLPKEISEKIADIRVFALGYASEEVKRLLTPYCAGLRKQAKQIKYRAEIETCDAEDLLSDTVGFDNLEGVIILKTENLFGNLYIKLEDNDFLIFENAKITEGKDKTINRYDGEIPNPECTRILAAELHRLGYYSFEACFLVVNSDRYENEELWYLSVRCTDIITKSE